MMGSRSDHNRLSFDKSEFDAEDFSVDEWIQKKRDTTPLDVLRDDLGIHLKFLRSSVIELINQDYGHFVNLSSNLVGLDGKIQNIQGPLCKCRADLQRLLDAVNSTLKSLEELLEYRQRLRTLRFEIKCLRLMNSSLEASSQYIESIPASIQSEKDFTALCLACDEIGATKFLLTGCSDSQILNESKSKLERICEDALAKLSTLLRGCCEGESTDTDTTVKYILHMFAELNAEDRAEHVFSEIIFAPMCESVLSKKGNVSALLDQTESFIESNPVVQFSKRLDEFSWLVKYDFVGRGIFPKMVSIMSKQFPHIWSPAIPDTFHTNWTRCEAFIFNVEKALPSLQHLRNFRESADFKDFMSKWQFPVYFQLRFHNFALELESALENYFSPSPSSDFKLDSTRVTVKVIKQCWNKDKIFISHLYGRFLKASSLFTSRYLNGAIEALTNNTTELPLELLVNLYFDINLAEMIIGQILVEKINEIPRTSHNGAEGFVNAFSWKESRRVVENRMVNMVVEKSSASMTSVTEVPRLFRRTNRDAPTKHNEYVDAILLPIQTLKGLIAGAHMDSLWDVVGVTAATQISQKYQSQVQEVLISVQRMEESLKRLRQVKGTSQAANNANAAGDLKSLSDDDKIRSQILLDVNHFCFQMGKLCPSLDTSILKKMFSNIHIEKNSQ